MTTNDRDGEYYYLFLKGSDIFQEVSFALLGGVRMSNDKAITTATTTTNDRDGEYYIPLFERFRYRPGGFFRTPWRCVYVYVH
jgi:hypothetical protein